MLDHILIKKCGINTCFSRKNIITIFLSLAVIFLFPIISLADLSADVSISATVLDNGQANKSSSGGGSSVNTNSNDNKNNTEILPTDITFSGVAYPKARIILLLNGIETAETNAEPNASFSLKLSALTPGVKIFSVVAEDVEGQRYNLITIPITIKEKTSTNVAKLFIPPTLSLNKTSYEKGQDISVHGYSAPNSTVFFVVDAKDNIDITANSSGLYTANIKTDSFLLGDHSVAAKAETIVDTGTKTSGLGKLVDFAVVLDEVKKVENKTEISVVADINNDAVINIADFSILAFWYQKPTAPKTVDLNGDGKITIADFSILAYYWNG